MPHGTVGGAHPRMGICPRKWLSRKGESRHLRQRFVRHSTGNYGLSEMLLRVSEERLGETTVVHVAGRLEASGVGELEHVCRAAGGRLRLELSCLLHSDEVGLAFLRSLRESGAELVGVSPFLQLLLNNDRRDDEG